MVKIQIYIISTVFIKKEGKLYDHNWFSIINSNST
nr:MAG TPA: hypothetical protein [Caudoviricetes sp.]